jgi:hypothetical protein
MHAGMAQAGRDSLWLSCSSRAVSLLLGRSRCLCLSLGQMRLIGVEAATIWWYVKSCLKGFQAAKPLAGGLGAGAPPVPSKSLTPYPADGDGSPVPRPVWLDDNDEHFEVVKRYF